MPVIPVIETARLMLRRPCLDDAPSVRRIHSIFEVANGVLTIPHPYPEGEEVRLIERWNQRYDEDLAVGFVIIWRTTGDVIGVIGCSLDNDHKRAHMGYVIDPPYWGRGIATEAGRALVDCVFRTTDMHKIDAAHYPDNPASGRVLQKLGFTYEGTRREHFLRFGEFRDSLFYGLIRTEHERTRDAT